MKDFDFYLVYDPRARARTSYWAFAAGVVIGSALRLLGAGLSVAAIMCVITMLIVEVVFALRYVQPDKRRLPVVSLQPLRRRLIWSGSLAFIVSLLADQDFGSQAYAAEKKLLRASADPSNPASVKAVESVLKEASASGLTIPKSVIEDTGLRFIDAPALTPASWDAALRFIEYQSVQNASAGPSFNDATRNAAGTKAGISFEALIIATRPGMEGPPPLLCKPGTPLVDHSISALFARIGNEDQSQERSPLFWVIEGDGYGFLMDGYHVRNTALRDALVIYNGGRILLENVFFFHCKFQMAKNKNTQDFAKAILSNGPSLNFSRN